jgi:hypothetical protein
MYEWALAERVVSTANKMSEEEALQQVTEVTLRRTGELQALVPPMTPMTDSCNWKGRGLHTFSNERSFGLGYRSACCGSFSSEPLGEFLVPCIVFWGYARTNSFHCFIKVSP